MGTLSCSRTRLRPLRRLTSKAPTTMMNPPRVPMMMPAIAPPDKLSWCRAGVVELSRSVNQFTFATLRSAQTHLDGAIPMVALKTSSDADCPQSNMPEACGPVQSEEKLPP